MKSNEEFIQGIYAKAEKLQKEQENQQSTTDNLIKIESFHKKLKRVSSYAAGLAACFACGAIIYTGIHTGKDASDSNNRMETRGVSDSENQPESASLDKQSAYVLKEGQHYLQCRIISAEQTDGIGSLEVEIVSDKQKLNPTAVLKIAQEDMESWQKAGEEIVVCVYDADEDGNYTVAPDSQVFVYTQTKENEKQFQSAEGTIITEGEVKEGIYGIQ